MGSLLTRTLLAGALLVGIGMPLLCASAQAEPLAAAGGYDIGALLDEARGNYDLSRTDAVILVEDHHVRILEDGGRQDTVHRIVWMGTELGLDIYADLRVPYRSDRVTLEVHALRTWRDGRWWPDPDEVSPTAVVETLPGSVSRAEDYTAMRETMLLHDGVELPCIVETLYTLTEEPPSLPLDEDPRQQGTTRAMRSHDGLWRFARFDPIIRSVFRLTAPKRLPISHVCRNGAPEARVADADRDLSSSLAGAQTYVWQMGPVDRIPPPVPHDLLAHSPYVVWSAWSSWGEIGDVFEKTFELACDLDAEGTRSQNGSRERIGLAQTLRDSLTVAIERQPDARARAEAVADFVNEWTRHASLDLTHWRLAPRPALRVWETAYGHTLDRAVLATVLFRQAGLSVVPLLRSQTRGEVDPAVPALAWFDDLRLGVLTGDGSDAPFHAVYSPGSSGLADAPADLAGWTVWSPHEVPHRMPGPEEGSLLVILTLEPGEEGAWSGSGYLRATGGFSPYTAMVGLGSEAKDHLSSVARVLEGAEIGNYSLATFERDQVVAGFSVSWTEGDADEHGRVRMTLGSPGGGLVDHLPHDVHLYDERRGSPVTLQYPMSQRVELRIKVGEDAPDPEKAESPAADSESPDSRGVNAAEEESGGRVVYTPDESTKRTTVGRERVSVERKGKWLHLVREIEIERTSISPAEWPELRALLLQETSDRNGTLLLK